MRYTVKVNKNGDRFWYEEGTNTPHREDGPAVELSDGTKKWIKYGLYHREDGPAIMYSDGVSIYCFNGTSMAKNEWEAWKKKANRSSYEVTLDQISEKFGIPIDKLKIKK